MKPVAIMVNPAIWNAARDGRADDVDIMCRVGYDLEQRGGGAWCTPLLIAVQRFNFDCMRVLIKNNANVDAIDCEGRTALHLIAFEDLSNKATDEDRDEVAVSLINGGAITSPEILDKRINAVDDLQYTPTTYAVINNKINLVKLLFMQGANMSATDGLGYTLLHHAVETHNIPMASYLLGPECTGRPLVNLKTNRGESPLRMAVYYACGNFKMNFPTVDPGPDGTRPNQGGMVRLLLDKGADFPSYAHIVIKPGSSKRIVLDMLKEEPSRRIIQHLIVRAQQEARHRIRMYHRRGQHHNSNIGTEEPLDRGDGIHAVAIDILKRCIQAENVFLVKGCGIDILEIIAGLDPVKLSCDMLKLLKVVG
jgi:Ankyrin repeats (3 copies)